jgi:NitT/TauT family transport system permease protein
VSKQLHIVFDYTIALAALLFVWWFASGPMGMPPYLLPSPAKTYTALINIAASGELFVHLRFTLGNMLLGLATGCIAGVALAYIMARLPSLSLWLDGPLVILQTAPKIALAPLFVVWFGFGILSKVILVFSLVFFPVFIGALAGFRASDKRLEDLSTLLGLRPLQRFFQIELMSAMPEIFVGLKIGAVQALVGAILAEWMSGKVGLGYLMTFASATYKTPLLFAAVGMTVLLGILMHSILGLFEKRFLSWKGNADG